MLTMIVKADRKGDCQRITIPKLIRKIKHWENTAIFKIRIQDNHTVTIEGYLTDDDIEK